MALVTLLRSSRGFSRLGYVNTNVINRQILPTTGNACRVICTTQPKKCSAIDATGAEDHDYRRLWKLERYVAVSMIGVIPAAFFITHPAMDFLIATTFVMHGHWGLEGVLQDYAHGYPSASGERRKPWLVPLRKFALYAMTITAFAGLMNFNYNDVGIQEAVKMIFKIGVKQ